jgi:hypothetical protein
MFPVEPPPQFSAMIDAIMETVPTRRSESSDRAERTGDV